MRCSHSCWMISVNGARIIISRYMGRVSLGGGGVECSCNMHGAR